MSPFFRKLTFFILARPKLAACILKIGFNYYPAIRRTGCHVTQLTADLRHIHICLPLNWKTRNLNGSLFGGSLFAATDPFYMSMLYFNLGDDFVVWDKGGTIRFKRPALSAVRAEFHLEPSELDEINQLLSLSGEITRNYPVQLIDSRGNVCAEVERILYIAKRSTYETKLAGYKSKELADQSSNQ